MIFDKDLEDKPLQEELPFFDIKNQLSTVFTNGRMTPMPSFSPFGASPFFENPQMQFQTSLDKELYQHNASLIQKSIISFIRYCLNCSIDDTGVFQDGNIFCFEQENNCNDKEELIESLVIRNQLLTPWKKKQMVDALNQYEDLKGVFREIKDLCGRSITRELMYICCEVLAIKLKKLEELQKSEINDLLPRMQRFWGDENDQRIIRGGWNIYYEADYNQVKFIAASDMEALSSSLYFSKRIKHLILGSVRTDLIADVNLVDKFTTLVTFIAEGLMLSMQGISQKDEDFDAFVSDLNYTTAITGEVECHSSKKIKGEDQE